MFLKVGLSLPASPTGRDVVAKGELELRSRQSEDARPFPEVYSRLREGVHRPHQPLAEHPQRPAVACDYDITRADVLEARHFDDDIFGLWISRFGAPLPDQERRHLWHPVPRLARSRRSRTYW